MSNMKDYMMWLDNRGFAKWDDAIGELINPSGINVNSLKLMDLYKNDAHPNGSLVVDVLNDNEMIMGQYGKYKGPCQGEGVEYKLRQPGQAGTRYTVNFWIESDAVAFHQSLPDGTFGNNCPDVVWQTVEEARIHWDELIAEGYIRVENS